MAALRETKLAGSLGSRWAGACITELAQLRKVAAAGSCQGPLVVSLRPCDWLSPPPSPGSRCLPPAAPALRPTAADGARAGGSSAWVPPMPVPALLRSPGDTGFGTPSSRRGVGSVAKSEPW